MVSVAVMLPPEGGIRYDMLSPDDDLKDWVGKVDNGNPLTDKATVGVFPFREVTVMVNVVVPPGSAGGRLLGETESWKDAAPLTSLKSFISLNPPASTVTGYTPGSRLGTVNWVEKLPDEETVTVEGRFTLAPPKEMELNGGEVTGKPEPDRVTLLPAVPKLGDSDMEPMLNCVKKSDLNGMFTVKLVW